MNKKPKRGRWIVLVALVALGFLVAPSYVRAYRIDGSSDAPTYLHGDTILVNKAAYDVRLPYLGTRIFAWREPARGDVILLRRPGVSYLTVRRIMAVGGDTIQVSASRVLIDGHDLTYRAVDTGLSRDAATENKLGTVVELETLGGHEHPITYTPGGCSRADHGPVEVPQGHYFVMGDNRDHCIDSRYFGTVPRDRIAGKVMRILFAAPGRGES